MTNRSKILSLLLSALMLLALLCALGGTAWAETYDIAVGVTYAVGDTLVVTNDRTWFLLDDDPYWADWDYTDPFDGYVWKDYESAGSYEVTGITKTSTTSSQGKITLRLRYPLEIYVTKPAGRLADDPIGFRVKSGSGTEADPYTFEFVYDNSASSFTVSFNANGAGGGRDPVTGVSGSYTLPTNTFTRTGYVFTGWKVNNTGALLQPGDAIDVTANVTLYAQWEQGVYTLEVSHGTATFNGVTASTLTGLHYGDVVTVTADEPAEGEVFDRWNSYNGGSFGSLYAATTTFTMPAQNASIWVRYKDEVETCTHHDGEIICYAWEGDAPLPDTAGYYFLTEDVTITEPWEPPQGTTALCLHNHKITMTGDGPAIRVGSGSTLLLLADNQIWDERNTVQHAAGASGCGVQVDGGSYTQEIARVLNHNGGGLVVNSGSATIGYRCHIGQNGGADVPGAVIINGGSVMQTSGIISENTASISGVFVNGGSFGITGGSILDNDAKYGVCVEDGTFKVGYTADPGVVYLGSGLQIGFTGYALQDGVVIPVVMEDGFGVFTGSLRRSGSTSNFVSVYGDFNVDQTATGEAQLVPVLLRPDLVLPDGLTAIEESAFEGDTGFTSASVPESCASIGVTAFKGCTGLTQITLPKDCDIRDSAFNGCTSLHVIFAPAGGATEQWARDHGVPFANTSSSK